MAWKSSKERYGTVAIWVHWTSALLIIALLVSGFRAAATIDPSGKAALLRVHASMGTLILLLTLFRLAWWLFADRKPDDLSSERLLNLAARTVHILFYIVIIGMTASGIGMLALSGAGPAIFASGTAALPDFWSYAPRLPHGAGGRALVVLLTLHVLGALYHHFIRKDRIFARMGLGR